MWIGVGTAVAVAIVGGIGWSFFSGGFDSATASDSQSSQPDISNVVAANDNSGADDNRPDRPQHTLASLPNRSPALSPEQIAAQEREKRKQQQAIASQKHLDEKILPYLNQYCADCHGPDSEEAGINIARLTSGEQLLTERKKWERIFRMINSGAMPPSDYDPQPKLEEQESIAELLHDELFSFDCEIVYNPGRSTVQRLNKAEYNNTIQDLFGIKITPADDFPADDVGEGFDNIGDVLSLPPLLLEKYLNAAEEVANAVVDSRDFSKPILIPANRGELTSTLQQKRKSDDPVSLYTSGEAIAQFDVPATGDYEIRTVVRADQAGDEKAKFAIKVDSVANGEREVQQHHKYEDFTIPVTLEAGTKSIAVAFLNDKTFPEGPEGHRDRNILVKSIALFGPLHGGVPKRSEIHLRFVTATPGNELSVLDAAQKVLQPVMEKAFRRPVTTAEVFRYGNLVQSAVNDMGETYEAGISLALQAILVAPEFLFRLEKEPSDGEAERSLDDYEIASRLSYFLWSSMPDDELFALAKQNKLTQPDTLRQQIKRMLANDKSNALVSNFASQWLNLRNLDDVTPDTDIFKSFNDNLRADMRKETEMLFQTVMREDRSIEELLSADFTFVNKRLAEHYGISGVNEDKFERVSLAGTNRSGVLTHASILTLTSNPGRTSPVKRGKWIMENIFGDAPPPPPPGVPTLEETEKLSPDATLREQLAKHREDPGCAACHKLMDPLGLGLENFDAIGKWRDKEEGRNIDASGSLPSGEIFNSPLELVKIVQNRREQFFRTVAEKMLVYSIGRGAEYYDKCTIDKCLTLMKERNQRFSALIEGIVLSDPFLKKQAAQN